MHAVLLIAHPGTPAGVDVRIECEAARSPGGLLRLDYRLSGALGEIVLPAPAPVAPARRDGLWRQSCMEAFVGCAGASEYLEFNFSPSGDWAVYGFSDYRCGMRTLGAEAIASIDWRHGTDSLALAAVLRPADCLSSAGATLRIGFAAVIAERSGTMSYWALRHPEGPADFHHAAGFALELPAVMAERDRPA